MFPAAVMKKKLKMSEAAFVFNGINIYSERISNLKWPPYGIHSKTCSLSCGGKKQSRQVEDVGG